MSQLKLVSFCGLYCGGCRSYEENSDVGCHGCREETELVNDCPTRKCAMAKGLTHCGECDTFPCSELNDFYNDGIAHHALARRNIELIRLGGLSSWLNQQEEELRCECGKRSLWFAEDCQHQEE